MIFSLVLDIAGVALIGGLAYMMYRRGWLKLPKLDYARPDRAPGDPDFTGRNIGAKIGHFFGSLLIIGCTGYVLEAARLVWLQDRAGCVGHALVVARGRAASPKACARWAFAPTRPGCCATASGGFTD